MVEASNPEACLKLTYYAHCAFLWHTPQGVRVIIDPYQNRCDRYWFTREFPTAECDLALITHAHFDHDAVTRLPESSSVIRMPGEFRCKDVEIRGILDKHSGVRSKGMPNVMFRLETAGIRFLHIGDNYIDWSEEIKRAAGKIDVLMLTVDDSCHLLSYSEVDTMIAMVKPRVVVPMHYRIPGLMPETTTLKSIDGWLATRSDVRYLKSHRIALSEECLPPSPEVWVFDPSPEVFTAASMPPSIHGE